MKTAFYDVHRSYGAKMVDFHGWEMPLQYTGIIDEHINTRTNVGIFDVSHMGRFEVRGANALDALQLLVTKDVAKLRDHKVFYSVKRDISEIKNRKTKLIPVKRGCELDTLSNTLRYATQYTPMMPKPMA
jgi:hypothetical protein